MIASPRRRFDLYGGNSAAYNSREAEVLLAGAAGSGKSLAWLAKILTLAGKYPGARQLIVRKTRESLTESILVTWERDILGPNHPVLTMNPTLRRVRQSYRFANRSEVVVGGLDKPDKILSSEWDLIYAAEATDLTLVDWETLGGRLRAGVVPFQQLAADCNPTTPHHWLYKRRTDAGGPTRLYTSKHADNPRFFNRKAQQWTPDGERYLARLGLMTGARRDRFLKGEWVAAEGLVYAFDAGVHVLPESWVAPPAWPRVWAIDWGKTSPTVLGLWAVDADADLMVGYREVYQTRLRPDQLGAWAKAEIESGREPLPRAVLCDHDTMKEGYKEAFEKASGLTLELADKADRDKGIEACQARFDHGPGVPPRIQFRANARETLRGKEPDRVLADSGRPTSGIEELSGYTFDPDFLKDQPIADNDHFCDQMRYAERWVSANLGGLAGTNPYGANYGAPADARQARVFRR